MAKKRFKRSAVLFLILSLVALLAAACGSSKDNNASGSPSESAGASSPAASSAAPEPSKDPVELTIISPNSWAKSLDPIVKLYEEKTGNKIKVDVYPDEQYLNIQKTKMSTNDAPDLLYVNLGQSYIPFSFLAPITGSAADRMEPNIKKAASKDGQVYEAPASLTGYFGIIYNKELFEKAGVKLPLKTYQEFLDACEALLKIGVAPIGVAGKSVWTTTQLPLIGGSYIFHKNPTLAQDISSNKVKAHESPEFIEMSERMVALKKYFNKDYLSSDQAIIQKGLLDGTIAMEFYPDVTWPDFEAASPENAKKLAYMPYTLGDDYISATFSASDMASFAVPKNAKHVEEAVAFINFMSEPDNFMVYMGDTAQGNAPYEGIKSSLNPFQQSMKDLVDANGIPTAPIYIGYLDPNFQLGNVNKMYNDMYAGKPVKEALEEWYKDYSKVNTTAKTPGF